MIVVLWQGFPAAQLADSVAPPSACYSCRHQLGDVGWQPSKLELEAALGASRERQAELEWRLGAMEGLLRQHTALLAPPAAPPLGSLLDAIDDGHVSPRRQVCCERGLYWSAAGS